VVSGWGARGGLPRGLFPFNLPPDLAHFAFDFPAIPVIPPLALGGDFRNVLGEGEALGEALGGLSLVCSLLHARARAYSHKKMMRYALWGLLMPPEQSKRIPVRR